jgi:uncharacterized phage protein (TIGR02220 family)
MISPEFWTDEKLGLMPVEARLLFMGLVSNADDAGRLPGNTLLVKSMVFPYDNYSVNKIDEWLKLLCQQNLIIRYKIDSQTYIQVVNFLKHQTINRPTPSRIPGFIEDELQLNEDSLNTHGGLTEDSLLIEKKRREEKVKESNIPFEDIISYLNEKAVTSYKHTTPKTQEHIKARWNEKFTLDDFITVIDKKCTEWLGTDQEKYLRPETLFGTKFEGYLNQKETSKKQTTDKEDSYEYPDNW